MGKIKRLLKTAWVSERRLFLAVMGQSLFDGLVPMADIVGIGAVIDALMTGQSFPEASGSAWELPGRSTRTHRFWCWTNPPPAWMRRWRRNSTKASTA